MYEKDGEKYFVFDSHLHFWDASPDNWVKGHEEYAKGWIECFHAYQGLGPAETHWTLEHESDRRKRKTAPVSETGLFEAKALRSNQTRAGRKSAASSQATRN
jgi:hypothetical protein